MTRTPHCRSCGTAKSRLSHLSWRNRPLSFRSSTPPMVSICSSIPLTPAVTGAYVPSRITAADYPRLVAAEQSTDTIAVGTVMVAAEVRNPFRPLPHPCRFCRRAVHELSTAARAGPSSEVAGSQYRRGVAGLGASSCGTAMASAECADCRQHIGRIVPSPLRALYRRAPSKQRRRPDAGCGKELSFRTISLIDRIGQTRGRASRPRICNESKLHGSDRFDLTRSCPRFRLMRPVRRATASAGWPS